jgi:hypothetical protein
MRIRRLLRPVVLAAVLPLAGCYVHHPLADAVPAPNTRIVATVTDSGTFVMSNAIGAGAVEVEGVVESASGDAWQLQLLRVQHRNGTSIPWNRESVSFPRGALSRPVERRLDRSRSWLAAGGITIGALLLGHAFRAVIGGDAGGGGTTSPQHTITGGGGK